MRKELSIVIVNFNTKILLRQCLSSILRNTQNVNYEIIVVDNSSNDGSCEMVTSEFPLVKIMRNADNRGFSCASNQGMKSAEGEFILLLNSDTIVIEDCLHNTIDFMRKNQRLGILGCRVINEDNKPQYSCFHDPNIFSELAQFTILIIKDLWNPFTWFKYMKYFNYKKIRTVDCVSGCFLLIRSDVINKVGLLDENMFMYQEDADFCRRVRNRSCFEVIYYPFASIVHLSGRSAQGKLFPFAAKRFYESTLYYLKKYNSRNTMTLFRAICKLVWTLEKCLFCLLKANTKFNKKYKLLSELLCNDPQKSRRFFSI